MKIAIIIASLANRGQIRIVYELVNEFLKNNLDVTIYYFDEKNDFKFSCKTKKIKFFQSIDFDMYDIIHSHGIRPNAYIYMHNKNIKKAKTITTLHSYIKESLKSQYNIYISLIFTCLYNIVTTKHDAVVVLSNDAKEYYSKFWKNKNIYVIYNGISEYLFNKNNKNNKNKIYIGAVGLMTTIKGFEQLIKVLIKNKNLFLYLIGNGKEENSLKELAINLKVENCVHFFGFQKNVGSFLAKMDIFIIPSRAEGFPVALLEAASAKKAVVCSDIPIFRETFSKNEVTFFELDNIESLHKAILKAYERKSYFENNIYEKFITNYTSNIMANKYINLYEKLMNDT